MIKKFRNSLFGFNRDDVMSYVLDVKESEQKHRKNIKELEDKVSALEADNGKLCENVEEITKKLELSEEKIKEFEAREEEIARLGESIGRLYLVAQANAGAILSAAHENAEISQTMVEKNISAADDAETELTEISRALDEKTRSYLAEIAELKRIVAETKERISSNCANIEEIKSETASVLKGVTE